MFDVPASDAGAVSTGAVSTGGESGGGGVSGAGFTESSPPLGAGSEMGCALPHAPSATTRMAKQSAGRRRVTIMVPGIVSQHTMVVTAPRRTHDRARSGAGASGDEVAATSVASTTSTPPAASCQRQTSRARARERSAALTGSSV